MHMHIAHRTHSNRCMHTVCKSHLCTEFDAKISKFRRFSMQNSVLLVDTGCGTKKTRCTQDLLQCWTRNIRWFRFTALKFFHFGDNFFALNSNRLYYVSFIYVCWRIKPKPKHMKWIWEKEKENKNTHNQRQQQKHRWIHIRELT